MLLFHNLSLQTKRSHTIPSVIDTLPDHGFLACTVEITLAMVDNIIERKKACSVR